MAALPGTNVAAPIRPFDSADTYPTHVASEGQGGYYPVADITARNAIPAARRTIGQRVFVISTSQEFRLVGGILDANWVDVTAMSATPVLSVDIPIVLLRADVTGAVTSGLPAVVDFGVTLSGAADTGWTFSKVDGSGVTSSINSSTGVVTITACTGDTGAVTVTAAKAGQASLVLTTQLAKVRPPGSGSIDGGTASSVYGGTSAIDGGGA